MIKNLVAAVLITLSSWGALAQSPALSNAAKLRAINIVTDPAYAGGAKCNGVTDDTAAIQAAHAAAVATNFADVVFPSGTCIFTSLTWSPFVRAVSSGETILKTALAAGKGIHISTQYGDRTTPLTTGFRTTTPVFDGRFILYNTNAASTATALHLGDVSPSTTYTAHSIAFTGLQIIGWADQVTFGANAYDIDFNGSVFDSGPAARTARAVRVPATAVASANGINFNSSRFRNLAEVVKLEHASMAMDLHFNGSSFEANLAIVVDSQSANAVLDFNSCHMEINEYAPFVTVPMFVANNSRINISGGLIFIGDSAGAYSNPVVTNVKNSGRVDIRGVKYMMATGLMTLHAASANSYINVDATPDVTNTPTSYVTLTAGATQGYNGIRYERTTFTATITGMTAVVTATAYVERIGNIVTVNVPDLSGTSNNVAKTITGLPARFYPARNKRVWLLSSDNGGAFAASTGVLDTSGVLTAYATSAFGAWTAAGTAQVSAGQFSYSLD